MIKNLNSSWWHEKLSSIEAFVRGKLTDLYHYTAGDGISITPSDSSEFEADISVKVDDSTIKVNSSGQIYSTAIGCVTDVKVCGSSVVSGGIASISKADNIDYGVVRIDDATIKWNTTNDTIYVPCATNDLYGAVKSDNLTTTIASGRVICKTATAISKGIVQPDNTTINVNDGIISVRTATSANAGIVKPYSDDFVMVNNELRLKHKQIHVHWIGVPYDKAPYFEDNYNNTIQYPCCTYEVNYNSIPTSGTCYGAEGLYFTITHNPSFNTFTVNAVNSYITIVAADNAAATYTCRNTAKVVEYSTDKVTWNVCAHDEFDVVTTLCNAGETCYLRSNDELPIVTAGHLDSVLSNIKSASGNLNTLINYSNPIKYESGTPLPSNYALCALFKGCTSLVNISGLTLPATTLAAGCYNYMFSGCTSITSAPSLPATTLTANCYSSMFQGCTSLITAPTLPATTLTANCYQYMFQGCTSLTSAPTLPATALTYNCYTGMFQGCTSLTTAPTLPATTLDTNCYYYMFKGCTSLTTAPTLPATALAYNCYGSMFYGCSSLTSAPTLPATTLETNCYYYMFNGCTSLTSAPTLSATELTPSCYQYMFQGCTSLTSAPTLPATTLATNCYSSMFKGCTSLTTTPTLSATELTPNCYQYMFQGCTSLTSAPTLPATTLATNCYSSMFNGCTSLTSAPTLPATTLETNCYYYMFSGCTSLTTANVYATTDASGARNYMFNGCSATGAILHVATGLTWDSSSSNGSVGSNWTIIQDR